MTYAGAYDEVKTADSFITGLMGRMTSAAHAEGDNDRYGSSVSSEIVTTTRHEGKWALTFDDGPDPATHRLCFASSTSTR